MQSAAPEAFDLSKETEETKKGTAWIEPSAEYARKLLAARRWWLRGGLQLNHGGGDAHGDLEGQSRQVREEDRPADFGLTDLKRARSA
jgi:hypothetical protein